MPTLTTYYGLVEQAKRLDPDGKLSTIVEVLNREMGNILAEAPWLPSNDTWTNKTLRRGTLPTSSRRKLNSGVAKSNSRTTEVMDVIEMREVYAEYDKDYIDAFPEPGRARLMEAEAFLEGLGQDLVSDIAIPMPILMVCTALLRVWTPLTVSLSSARAAVRQ